MAHELADTHYTVFSWKTVRDVTDKMPNLYPLARPVFGLLKPEAARDLTVWCLKAGLGRLMVDGSACRPDPALLSQRLWGITFSNPIGLAAGFDKDARVPDAVLDNWGLGFAEVGTVTPRPQPGNPKPRVFRLRDDEAIINRMGFNSCGLSDVVSRLRRRRDRRGIIGLNLGKNRETEDAAAERQAERNELISEVRAVARESPDSIQRNFQRHEYSRRGNQKDRQ